MSFTAMAWASRQKTKNSTQKLVLLMLANYADDQDKCWPSKQTLADMCCMSKAAICSSILKLQDAGLLSVEKRDGTSSIIRLHTGIHQEDRGCPPRGQGVSTRKTGGVHHVDTNLSMNQSEETIIETSISVDAEFEAFWAAYPKRPNNPKQPALRKYKHARLVLKVSHETLVNAARSYAQTRAGEDPQFTAQTQTWLNQRRWEEDYSSSADVKKSAPDLADSDLDALCAKYPGFVGDRPRAKALMAAEVAKGATLEQIYVAAEKYRLFCKGPPYEDRKITPAMLETWLQFKWREMDGYEICTVGPDRIKTVRPKKVIT